MSAARELALVLFEELNLPERVEFVAFAEHLCIDTGRCNCGGGGDGYGHYPGCSLEPIQKFSSDAILESTASFLNSIRELVDSVERSEFEGQPESPRGDDKLILTLGGF